MLVSLPNPMLVDSLLSIVDRLIKLAKAGSKRRASVFNSLVQPTFDDLLAVHNDYITTLEHAEGLLSKAISDDGRVSAERVAEARAYLSEKRLALEPARQKLMALARIIASKETGVSTEIQAFLHSVGQYLCLGADVQSRPTTAATSILDRMQLNPARSLDYVREVLAALRMNWAKVCEAYMRLKIQVSSEA